MLRSLRGEGSNFWMKSYVLLHGGGGVQKREKTPYIINGCRLTL